MTAAGKFADEAAALGWTVERLLYENQRRVVVATRDHEKYVLAWHENDRGNIVFQNGDYFVCTEDYGDVCEGRVTNVKATLRDMAKHHNPNGGARLPFDAERDDDREILSKLAGRQIEWRNSISGLTETGVLPRGGTHVAMTTDPRGRRCVDWADNHGFHTARLSAITKVSDREMVEVTRPRKATPKRGKR